MAKEFMTKHLPLHPGFECRATCPRTLSLASSENAVRMARQMGYPVVMKLDSPVITHKTDVGGVCLNLENDADVYRAFEDIMAGARSRYPDAIISGVTIQPMIRHMDYELIVGSKKDCDFGPVILFGMGGTRAEILQDRSIALAPLNRALANKLMKETKVYIQKDKVNLQKLSSQQPSLF